MKNENIEPEGSLFENYLRYYPKLINGVNSNQQYSDAYFLGKILCPKFDSYGLLNKTSADGIIYQGETRADIYTINVNGKKFWSIIQKLNKRKKM